MTQPLLHGAQAFSCAIHPWCREGTTSSFAIADLLKDGLVDFHAPSAGPALVAHWARPVKVKFLHYYNGTTPELPPADRKERFFLTICLLCISSAPVGRSYSPPFPK